MKGILIDNYMKPLCLTIIIALFLAVGCNRDQVRDDDSIPIDTIKLATNELKPFIPDCFKLIDEYTVDLNQDSIEDKLIVICVNDSIDSLTLSKCLPVNFDSNTRPLLLLIRQSDGKLKQAARNDYAVKWDNCGYDTFGEISDVKSGLFSISLFKHCGGGPSTETIEFKYSAKEDDWLLNEYSFSYTSNTPSDSGDYPINTTIKTAKDFGRITLKDYDGIE